MRIKIDLYLTGQSHPSDLVEASGIKYGQWDAYPIADCIMLSGVDPASIPSPLPVWATVLPDR